MHSIQVSFVGSKKFEGRYRLERRNAVYIYIVQTKVSGSFFWEVIGVVVIHGLACTFPSWHSRSTQVADVTEQSNYCRAPKTIEVLSACFNELKCEAGKEIETNTSKTCLGIGDAMTSNGKRWKRERRQWRCLRNHRGRWLVSWRATCSSSRRAKDQHGQKKYVHVVNGCHFILKLFVVRPVVFFKDIETILEEHHFPLHKPSSFWRISQGLLACLGASRAATPAPDHRRWGRRFSDAANRIRRTSSTWRPWTCLPSN